MTDLMTMTALASDCTPQQLALDFITYKGSQWVPITRIYRNTNYYYNNQKYLSQHGQSLTLTGVELLEYKNLYHAQVGYKLKGPQLTIVDTAKATAYLHLLNLKSHTPLGTVNDTCGQSWLHDTATVTDITSTLEALLEQPVDSLRYPALLGCHNTILADLMRITQDKGLHWTPYVNGIYLPMVEASLAKGMEKDDYSSNSWGPKLPGTSYLLKGDYLRTFKDNYIREHGSWPYPRTRSLCIGDWEHAYGYLVQGKSTTANAFQSMGANSIQQIVTIAPPCPETWASEETLVDRVFKLMELSPISMQREACFSNSLANTPTTRRVDAIEHVHSPDGINRVHVYEFKKTRITGADVYDTVAGKGYLHLVKEQYPTSKVCLFMVGNAIDPMAQRLLECMSGVVYLPLSTLLNRILASIINSWPQEGHYQLRKHYLSQFSDILPQEMLSGPVQHPQIIATYIKPRTITT